MAPAHGLRQRLVQQRDDRVQPEQAWGGPQYGGPAPAAGRLKAQAPAAFQEGGLDVPAAAVKADDFGGGKVVSVA
jgi:hypothetical protein